MVSTRLTERVKAALPLCAAHMKTHVLRCECDTHNRTSLLLKIRSYTRDMLDMDFDM